MCRSKKFENATPDSCISDSMLAKMVGTTPVCLSKTLVTYWCTDKQKVLKTL